METLLNNGQKAFLENAISSPENIKAQDIEQLESMVSMFPQMSILRTLLARAYKNEPLAFGQKLKNAAAYVPERIILYQVVNEPEKLSGVLQSQIFSKAEIDKASTVIEPDELPVAAPEEHLLPAHLDTDAEVGIVENAANDEMYDTITQSPVVKKRFGDDEASPTFYGDIDDEIYEEITGIEDIKFENPPKPAVTVSTDVALAPIANTNAEQEAAGVVKDAEVAEEATADPNTVKERPIEPAIEATAESAKDNEPQAIDVVNVPNETIQEIAPQIGDALIVNEQQVEPVAEIPVQTVQQNEFEVAETISATAEEKHITPVAELPIVTVQENEPEVAEAISATVEEQQVEPVAEIPVQTVQQNEPEVAEAISATAEKQQVEPVAEIPVQTVQENEPEVAEAISATVEEQQVEPVAEIPVQTVQQNEPEVAEAISATAEKQQVEPVAEMPVQTVQENEPEVAEAISATAEIKEVEKQPDIRTEKPAAIVETGIRFLVDHNFGHSVSDALTGDDDEDTYPVESEGDEQKLSLRETLTNEFKALSANTSVAKDEPQQSEPIEEPETVSKYHDDKMPYTFMWWLDKTRKEHADTYQPYAPVALKPPAKTPASDKLQQQYYENIFNLTTIDDVDKSREKLLAETAVHDKQDAIIERFIQVEPQIGPPNINLFKENKAKRSAEDEDALVSETLARIYTDQMLYHKAISTYKKLLLKFPEKSAYFTAQIELLERKLK